MKRRAVFGLIGSVVAWPLAAHGQQPVPVIGFAAGTTSGGRIDLQHRTAKALGLEIADRLLALADELIE